MTVNKQNCPPPSSFLLFSSKHRAANSVTEENGWAMEDGNSSCTLDTQKPYFFSQMQNEHMNISFMPLTPILIPFCSQLLKERRRSRRRKEEKRTNKEKGGERREKTGKGREGENKAPWNQSSYDLQKKPRQSLRGLEN